MWCLQARRREGSDQPPRLASYERVMRAFPLWTELDASQKEQLWGIYTGADSRPDSRPWLALLCCCMSRCMSLAFICAL